MSAADLALALLLSQTCVAEISLQRTPEECAIMWEINATAAQARDKTVEQQTRDFNAYWRSAEQRANRPWIAHLQRSGSMPKGWPKSASWERHVERWLLYVERADQFVRDLRAGKPMRRRGKADTYGARCDDDDQRGRHTCDVPPCPEARLVPLMGGRTLQAYWDVGPCIAAKRARRTCAKRGACPTTGAVLPAQSPATEQP